MPLPRTAGQTRTGRPRSWTQPRRRGAANTLRGFYLLALATEGLHVLASSDVDSPTASEIPRRQHYLLALSVDELNLIAALRYAAGDVDGSFDARSACGINVSSDGES